MFGQKRHFVVPLVLLAAGFSSAGCQSRDALSQPQVVKKTSHFPSIELVMPGPALVDLAGPDGWPAGEMDLLNHRRNESLGADRLPVMASVNEAEVWVWDQQWILNGRSMENYLRSTRSIQKRDLR
jgi:hypothetical protein